MTGVKRAVIDGAMRVILTPHPTTPCPGASLIVDVQRLADGRLHLWYRASGVRALRLSHEGSQPDRTRRDELWMHTCCEAFIAGKSGYLEFNFGPGGDWAAYRFSGYREGVSRPETPEPRVEAHRHGADWQLQAFPDLKSFADLTGGSLLKMALSAVLEMKDGSKSYWALAHPSDKPDFHHPDSFVLEIL